MSLLPPHDAASAGRPGSTDSPVCSPPKRHPAANHQTIRAMTRSDIETVATIEADSHPLDAWSAEAFRAAVDEGQSYLCRVAEDTDAGVIGYAVTSLATDQADLQNLTVRADWRRRGLGRWLLDDILGEVARRGVREAFLEVRHDNGPAIGFYTSYGFAVVGRRRNYYASGVDGVVMRAQLDAARPNHPPVTSDRS